MIITVWGGMSSVVGKASDSDFQYSSRPSDNFCNQHVSSFFVSYWRPPYSRDYAFDLIVRQPPVLVPEDMYQDRLDHM